MRAKIIIPVSTDVWNEGVRADYERIKEPDTVIDVVHLKQGPEALQCEYDEARITHHVLTEVHQTLSEDYQAIIIYCFSDPGLAAAREIATIPVLGMGESAQLFAMGLADRCGILTTCEQTISRHRRKLMARGFSHRFPSIRALDLAVLECDQKGKVTARALEVARMMVEKDGAEALVLGCASFFEVRQEINRSLGIPVVEPGTVVLKHAECLVQLGRAHSKRSYMMPLPVKEN